MTARVIHPMTRYVMSYLWLLVVYSETLDILLDDSNDDNPFPSSEAQDEEHLESMTWKAPSEADVLFVGQFGGKF
jgi:exocyst complex component 7